MNHVDHDHSLTKANGEKRNSQLYSLGAALLIQKWYRRYQARLEVKRRCAWMIYQTLEYAGEQNHAKVTSLQLSFVKTYDNKFHEALAIIMLESINRKQCIMSRPNIQMASTSISRHITVVGDLHGQYSDLQIILYKNGMPDVTNPYVFNGDFVDRGRKSVETLLTILCLMLVRPTSVFINRGNHEDLYVNCQYGFIKEIQKKYKSSAGMLVKCFAEFYRYLPVATLIDDKIFVCHGGISDETDLNTLGDLNRFSYLTLLKPVDELISNSDSKKQVSLLIRSHECKPEGFEWSHNKQLLTIFSASNYYTDGSNRGAIARISVDGSIQIIQYVTGGQKKFKTLRQKVSWAEESALTDLKNKIGAYSTELKREFQSLDPTNTGRISKLEWCKAMEKVLDLKLPWSTLQPRLVVTSKIPNQVPPSVTEEMYKFRDVLEGIFRAMDKDNSGRISLNEFKQACLRLPKWTKIDEQIVMDMARSIDINKDGLIDFNEFLETFRLVESDHDHYESITDQQIDE
ncbi:serine/threonine-protein phosphatase with EF-hands [Schistosoma bovis]|uniref:Serine/threonine-protein phosphatase n=1 Tax=Schistosoma bovis TaxID=6184 RepID=A0A430Q625_SCHBO|nr:serine/threonine-protein phosphatase with EF-hands [Schistosoma bovis]